MPPGYAEAIRARSLLGRISTPADFAATVLFLCSEEAAFITGSVLDAGGGGAITRRDGAATRARS
jgi:NAD(P)-dependent dehydrogenase (short-subunit alcohol dehydrogenase family)